MQPSLTVEPTAAPVVMRGGDALAAQLVREGVSELATARKHGIGLVTAVFSDNAYGNVRRTQAEQFENRVLGSDLVNPDFVALAESFGVRGARATTPAELEACCAKPSPTAASHWSSNYQWAPCPVRSKPCAAARPPR
jgi:thiamine pyrophosphate-dependent acetolactate synthase large subunit-like protein